jgi:hypothetical protein
VRGAEWRIGRDVDGMREDTRHDEIAPGYEAISATHVGTKKSSTALNRDCSSTADIFWVIRYEYVLRKGNVRKKMNRLGG